MSDADNLFGGKPLAAGQISATNVWPAYEASLSCGATEVELEAVTGLSRSKCMDVGRVVDAAATYAHFEWMFDRPNFADFVLAAVRRHGLASLGIVGLACKTVPTVGEALECHRRFQHLTNRTATYAWVETGDRVVWNEARAGAPRLGSQLVSDYAMLISVHLLRENAAGEIPVVAMHSRREGLSADERAAWERFVGAPIACGAKQAALVFPSAVLRCPVATADPELAQYFAAVLARAVELAPEEPALLTAVRVAIRDALLLGTPRIEDIAKRVGMSGRTLQRRLAELGFAFAELLDATRRSLAERYLADRRLSLPEVAYLLGYREQASFFRAFRRWHATTPASFREQGPPKKARRSRVKRRSGPD